MNMKFEGTVLKLSIPPWTTLAAINESVCGSALLKRGQKWKFSSQAFLFALT